MEPVKLDGISDYGKKDLAENDPDNAANLLIGHRSYKGTDDEAGRIFSDTPKVID
jgi:hypothetical protein